MTITLEKIETQQKELDGKEKEVAKAKHARYDISVKETEESLRA